ncbi:MAG: hypothetical protein JWO94_1371, partial [Verrucomicrobiaceae bacterium]|nr:hypothetical protein [Verrucomicrobiaceae bacterium]
MKSLLILALFFTTFLRAEESNTPAAALPTTVPSKVEVLPALSTLLDHETVAALATIPVQEAGRLKPFDTLARYRLLRFSGKRTLVFDNPETKKKQSLSAMEWMLVSLLRPDLAKDMPVFVVDNDAAVVELGLSTEKKNKRDRYSFNELQPGRETLLQKRREYGQLDAKKRTAVQNMIVNLGANLLDDEMLLTHFDFVRKPFDVDLKTVPAEILNGSDTAHLHMAQVLPATVAYLTQHPEVMKTTMFQMQNPEPGVPMQYPWVMNLVRSALGGMMSGNQELSLRIFPPPAGVEDVWNGPGWMIMDGVQGNKMPTAADLAWMAAYEDLYLTATDPAKFKAAALSLAGKIKAAAAARGEGRYINLEENYLQADYFTYALVCFLLGLIVLAVSWASPMAGWARCARQFSWASLALGTCLSVTGIVIRCIIMQRPPITTLYETIIFITTACALFGLIAESITRKGLGLLITAVAGTAGLFLSIRFETMEGQDTMQQLQAVLMTNFWLATHVPMVNLGYAASMVAAILSQSYFLRRMFGFMKSGDENARNLTRMTYGFVCAGVFLSLVGTILGGIWANYSWGRFWGWDPKENGALMIVLMCLVILHARLGGYIKEIGLHAMCTVLGMIVAFSWFGVNNLGVGLHAYGFTDGLWFWLSAYWGLQCLFLLYS